MFAHVHPAKLQSTSFLFQSVPATIEEFNWARKRKLQPNRDKDFFSAEMPQNVESCTFIFKRSHLKRFPTGFLVMSNQSGPNGAERVERKDH